ncbi:MAG: FAD binding domain-containing protein [Proteobacteria bacterium]|nr:FAD binding domain-containing protein [Pseudomonadota bacterium]
MKAINFTLNGKTVTCEVVETELLLRTLRERFLLKSVKEGCGIGECGTCTVLIDDEPHYSCLTLASKVDGRDVKTVEFLVDAGVLHPLQEAFIKYGAVQCGYCTPGMLLSAYSLLLKNREPDRKTIKEAISGNLCRCTGYIQIEEAIGHAADAVSSSEFRVSGKSTNGSSVHAGPEDSLSHITRHSSRGMTTSISKDEVLVYLSVYKDAKVIAGGTDLLVKAKKDDSVKTLVDITGISELSGISDSDGLLRIGAAETHARISANTVVKDKAQSLAIACGLVGSPQIRNMGTIGGNLVNASPAADSISPLLIHDAILSIESRQGERKARLQDFILAPYKTSIRPDEILTSISLKNLSGYREGYRRVTKRATWAIARLSVAWAILEEEGIYKNVRIAIGSCTPMPFRPAKVEALLEGRKKEKGIIAEAIELTLQEIKEITGIRPSFAYKIPVLEGILESALRG